MLVQLGLQASARSSTRIGSRIGTTIRTTPRVTMTIFATGGAGFLGSAVLRQDIRQHDDRVVNIDKLTYAGSTSPRAAVRDHPRRHAEGVDVSDARAIGRPFEGPEPDAVLRLAAESHADRSVRNRAGFV